MNPPDKKLINPILSSGGRTQEKSRGLRSSPANIWSSYGWLPTLTQNVWLSLVVEPSVGYIESTGQKTYKSYLCAQPGKSRGVRSSPANI